MTDVLENLFNPRTVAVIGASSEVTKLGGIIVKNNLDIGFKGELFPINPSVPEIQGLKAYPSIGAIGKQIDCAVIIVPASGVMAAVEDCVANKVPAAVICSSGFAEVSEEGRRLQEKVAAVAKAGNLRLIGPNTLGVMSFANNFAASFALITRHNDGKGWPKSGSVSIASQSGAMGTQILVLLRERGMKLAKWVATGNQIDIDVAECIEHLAADDVTKVIAVYMEGTENGAKLRAAFESARKARKPVVIIKVGRSEAGAKAAASHTASLAGSDTVYDSVFEEAGVIRVDTLHEMADVVAACSIGHYPQNNKVGIVTNSGGIGVLMADAAAVEKFELPSPSQEVQAELAGLGKLVVTTNPFDIGPGGTSNMGLVAAFADKVLEKTDFAGVLIFYGHICFIEKTRQSILETLTPVRERYPNRPIGAIGNMPPEFRDTLMSRGIMAFDDPTKAMQSLGALRRLKEAYDRPAPTLPVASPTPSPHPSKGAGSEKAAKGLLAEIGVTVVPDRMVQTAAEAVAAYRAFGTPKVVLKISSADIPHKSDIGGVAVGLASEEAVAEAFERIMASVKKARPDAKLDGILASPMIEDGIETIVGVSRDPAFGPIVLFGMGGIFVEIVRDVALRVAPIGPDVARQMIEGTAAYHLLQGARGRPPADIDALARTLSLISDYAARNEDLESIDINPLIVRPAGKGVVAVDGLVELRKSH